jgi:hypothetical protein
MEMRTGVRRRKQLKSPPRLGKPSRNAPNRNGVIDEGDRICRRI